MLFALLLACTPLTAEDCIPSLGDNCSCEPQCLTARQIKQAQRNGVCDLACMVDTGADAGWTCAAEDNECVVVEE